MRTDRRHPFPALIIIGGFPGVGKTAVSRHLASDFGLPRLDSDTLGQTVRDSEGIKDGVVDAYWIAYDILFRLCEEFLRSDVSVILDLTMGWEFQWQQIDGILSRNPRVRFFPIMLRCPRRVCIERIQDRYRENPECSDAPEYFLTEPETASIWEFLVRLDRPDIRFVDADKPRHKVYEEIREYLSSQL